MIFKLSTAVVLSLLVAGIFAEAQEQSEQEFLDASANCMKKVNVPVDYQTKFANFDFPDEEISHKYLHCVWTDMKLWDDMNGFKVEEIAESYKDRADPDQVIPTLVNCNRNPEKHPPMKWVYLACKCTLDTRVGSWFKEDVRKTKAALKKN